MAQQRREEDVTYRSSMAANERIGVFGTGMVMEEAAAATEQDVARLRLAITSSPSPTLPSSSSHIGAIFPAEEGQLIHHIKRPVVSPSLLLSKSPTPGLQNTPESTCSPLPVRYLS